MFLRIKAIARKEFIQLFRDSRTLGVILLLPVLMLILYGYAINTDVKQIETAVVDLDHSSDARDLVQSLGKNDYFKIVSYLDAPSDADNAIGDGSAKLAIVIPDGYAKDLARGRNTIVQVLVDGSDSTIARTVINYISAFIQSYSSRIALKALTIRGLTDTSKMTPVDLRPCVWYNPELKSTNVIVPGLIAVILMMLSALLTSMTIVRERERGTIEQLIVSPVLPHELIIGKLLPYVAISFVDIVVVIIAGRILFDVPMRGNPILLLVLSAVFLVAALGIGLLISTVSGTQQTAMTIAIMATMLPTVLLSGFVFPIMGMPLPIRIITHIIPARYFMVILRGIFLKGAGFTVLWEQAVPMLLFGVVALVISAKKFKKQL